VLGPTLADARVLEVFAGTGAVGIEALSRGAAHVTFVEQDPRAITLLKRNIARVGVENACAIIRDDFMTPRAQRCDPVSRYDFVFLDPPYEIPALESAVTAAARRLATGGRLVIEHSRRRTLPDALPGVSRYRLLEAGDSALSFYTAVEGA
jgi:16S rRNA (guanine966-N2)-methyltransferase